MAQLVCQACGEKLAYDEPIPRDAACSKCGRDLRCCRNCRHFDERFHNQCKETEAELVVDKTRRNFCEYFYYSRELFAGGAPTRDRAAEARAKLEALFKRPEKETGEGE